MPSVTSPPTRLATATSGAFDTPAPPSWPTAEGATDTPTATDLPGTAEPTDTPTATDLPGTSQPTDTPTPTSQSTDQPSPTPIPTLSNQPLIQPSAVQVSETTVTIPTYDYQSALVPTDSTDPIYPYPHLDFDLVGSKAPKSYRAIVLENAYVRVTILPDLGGRVYSWVDKTNDQGIAYSNPVIKPTDWGARGWWLATGGIEWCLPTDEHGLNEYRLWQTTLSSAAVTVKDQESRTELDAQVTLSLDSAHNYLVISPKITNNTGATKQFKFWINAMLAFSNNRADDSTQFIMPAVTQATIHSTGDSGLPASGTVDWPVYDGRDLSVIGSLDGWLGVFAYPNAGADFAGAYDATADMGVVRIFPASTATGVKFFTGRGIDTTKWTDDGSTYFELWGGLQPTFADETSINSGQSLTWEERWYPVSGLGGSYNYANTTAALRIDNSADSIVIALAASANLSGARVKLWQDEQLVAEWQATLGPGRSVSGVWQRPSGSCTGDACNRLGLQLLDADGVTLAQTGTIGP